MKFLKHFIAISAVFLSLIVVPFIACLLIQVVINLGNIMDSYVIFLSGYFIEGVSEIVAVFSVLIFLFCLGSYLFFCFICED